MTITNPSSRQKTPVLGVIDALSAGYDLVNHRPWLILVPVLLDLCLWWGPRLSVAPLIMDLLRFTTPPVDIGPEYAQTMEQARLALTQMAQEFNLFGLLAAGFLGVPSLVSVSSMGLGLLQDPPLVFQVSSWLLVFPLALGLLAGAMWIGALYLSPLAQVVRDDKVDLLALLKQFWATGWRFMVFLGLILGVLVFAGLPATLLLSLVMVWNPNIASFVLGLAWIVVLWTGFYLFFAVQSLTVGQAGVLRSLWNSLNVVRWNLGATLGLVVVVNVIQRGLPLAWQLLAAEPWGFPLGIFGNAYIGAGLMATSMLFYKQRFALWQELLVKTKEAQKAKEIAEAAKQGTNA